MKTTKAEYEQTTSKSGLVSTRLNNHIKMDVFKHGSSQVSLYDATDLHVYVQKLDVEANNEKIFAITIEGKNKDDQFVSMTIFSKDQSRLPVVKDLTEGDSQ